MATPLVTPTAHCGFHHRDLADCPPLDAELGDHLPELIAAGIPVTITPAVPWLSECSGCAENKDFPPNDAVALVIYTVSLHPAAYRYEVPVCPACLTAEVEYQVRRGANVTVHVPETIGATA